MTSRRFSRLWNAGAISRKLCTTFSRSSGSEMRSGFALYVCDPGTPNALPSSSCIFLRWRSTVSGR